MNLFTKKYTKLKKHFLKLGFRYLFVCFFTIPVLSIIFNYWQSKDIGMKDLVIMQLLGSPIGIFNMQSYMSMLLFDIPILFILCRFLECIRMETSSLLAIRLEKGKDLLQLVFWISICYIVSYVFITLSLYIISSVIVTGCARENSFVEVLLKQGESFTVCLLKFSVAKIFELVFELLCCMFWMYQFNNVIFGFVTVILGYLVNSISVGILRYNPIGISYISRWIANENMYSITYVQGILTLVTVNTVMIIIFQRSRVFEN